MSTAFTFEAVANNIPVENGEVSLALDKTGNPSIAFSERGSGQIMVARRNAGTWTAEPVPGGFIGSDSRAWLAIDSLGNPRLGYRHLNSGLLTHAIKGAGQWSSASIATRLTPDHRPGGVGIHHFALHPGRLDTDSRDVAYFAYVDLATNGIGFAHTGQLGPTPVPVHLAENDQMRFAGPSAAFDSSENYFVGYCSIFETGAPQDSFTVREAHVDDIEQGRFSTPVALDGPSQAIDINRPTSIARSFSGGCLAYFDAANKTLKASFSDAGVSRIEIVATNVNNVVTPSAAVNGSNFRIAYADIDAIKLASRSRFGAWTTETVDAVSGGPPSLAYDNAGTANIAYVANGGLKYARRSE